VANQLTLADTGIIVGMVDNSDQWHKWVTEQVANLPAPYLTCEAVITEACYLLRDVPNGVKNVFALLKSGALRIAFDLSGEVETVGALMDKYKDMPMDFADACLVRMSELHTDAVVFTVDGDFRVYRKNRRKQIPLVVPDNI